VSVNSPRLPRISPQLHHKNTTRCTRFSAKPPAKTHIHQRKKNLKNTHGKTSRRKEIAHQSVGKLSEKFVCQRNLGGNRQSENKRPG
jgi:hypothetical protein